MFRLGVKEHFMIAHSFEGEIFGPAQNVHGATYVVSAEFIRGEMDEHNLIVDIGAATELLRAILAPLNYQNLDEVEMFSDQNTTTEFLAKHIFDQLVEQVRGGALGPNNAGLTGISVRLDESHVAWATYEGTL
ncbi:MAG: 6-carboxytetrahydropterin synthase [Myxococcota bacterium]